MPLPVVAAGALAPIIALVIRFLVGTAIAKIVTAFGIALVTFTASSFVVDRIEGYLLAAENTGGIVSEVAVLIGFFDCLNILMSALVASIGIRQLRGIYNRMIFGVS